MPDQPRPDRGCVCNFGPVIIHSDHCCYRSGELDDYQLGKPLPCGHEGPIT